MANWYERRILPHIIRIGCGCAEFDALREPLIGRASGEVLELGIGAGANLRWYDPRNVAKITAVEPSPELRAMAAKAERPDGLAVEVRDGMAEALPFAEAQFDTVVCTYTLCTVGDPDQTLREARRVLRPGGRLLFCEHGLAPDPGIARWQKRLDRVWPKVFGGCHTARPVRETIARHFDVRDWEGGFQPKIVRLMGWMEHGSAVAA